MGYLVASCDYNEEREVYDNLCYGEELQRFDIGGVFQLVLKKDISGYHGYYKVHKSGETYTYDGQGKSKKAIIKDFWNKAKKQGAKDLRSA